MGASKCAKLCAYVMPLSCESQIHLIHLNHWCQNVIGQVTCIIWKRGKKGHSSFEKLLIGYLCFSCSEDSLKCYDSINSCLWCEHVEQHSQGFIFSLSLSFACSNTLGKGPLICFVLFRDSWAGSSSCYSIYKINETPYKFML